MPLLDTDFSSEVNKAIRHAVNYHGIDARLNMADWEIADLLTDEVCKHICGDTDYQRYEREKYGTVQ